jgi:hypothetical protein
MAAKVMRAKAGAAPGPVPAWPAHRSGDHALRARRKSECGQHADRVGSADLNVVACDLRGQVGFI